MNRLFQLLVGITCFFLSGNICFSQTTDTLKAPQVKPVAVYHSPKKAALLSAAFPGLGQAYNKKYWKMPVIYVGFGALGYAIAFNNKKYVAYRDAYRLRVDGDPNTNDGFTQYSEQDLVSLKNAYHRYRDLSVIGTVALYVLNIIDASVDAHLFSFDVSDDLSFRIEPSLNGYSFQKPYPGLRLTVKL